MQLVSAEEDRRLSAAKRKITALLDDFTAGQRATGITQKEAQMVHSRCARMLDLMEAESVTDLSMNRAKIARGHLRDVDKLGLSTCNQYLKALKRFTRYLAKEFGFEDRIQYIESFNAKTDVRHKRRVLSDADLARFLEAARTGPDFTWYGGIVTGKERELCYRLALGAGLRYSELRWLCPEAFIIPDAESLSQSTPGLFAEPAIVVIEAGSSKHRQRDEQPLKPKLAARFTDYLKDKPAGAPIWNLPDRAYEMVKFDLAACDPPIPYETEEGFFDFHSLRHTFGTHLGRAASIVDAQHLLRHADIQMSRRYMHPTRNDAVRALEALPDFEAQPSREEALRATGTDAASPLHPKGEKRPPNKSRNMRDHSDLPADSLRFPLVPSDDAKDAEKPADFAILPEQSENPAFVLRSRRLQVRALPGTPAKSSGNSTLLENADPLAQTPTGPHAISAEPEHPNKRAPEPTPTALTVEQIRALHQQLSLLLEGHAARTKGDVGDHRD